MKEVNSLKSFKAQKMGNESSNAKPFQAEPYILIEPHDNDNDMMAIPTTTSNTFSHSEKIYTMGFNAKWSMFLPNSITPRPRTSHFMVYLPDKNIAVVGYGIDGKDILLNDLWALDLNQMKWKSLDFDNQSIVPRNGTTAVLVGSKIYLFGGFSGNAYLADLHTIDLSNFKVEHINLPDQNKPSGRIGHVMAENNGQILIWGGYNGDWLSDLWIFNVATNQWREIPTDVKGRTSAAYASHGDFLYIFGAAATDSLLRFSWKSEKMELIKSTGSPPPSELSAASMIAVDRFLLLFGGKLEKKKYGLMYGFDTVKSRWFIFHVIPDGVSTVLVDGMIDKNGRFMVPRIWSASIVYRKNKRDVVLFLGAPLLEPPNLCVVQLGDALSILHVENDLLDTLQF